MSRTRGPNTYWDSTALFWRKFLEPYDGLQDQNLALQFCFPNPDKTKKGTYHMLGMECSISSIEGIEKVVSQLRDQKVDTYFEVGLHKMESNKVCAPRKKSTEKEIVAISSMCLDLDWHDGEITKERRDKETRAFFKVCRERGISDPDLVVRSGQGFWFHLILKKPTLIDDSNRELLKKERAEFLNCLAEWSQEVGGPSVDPAVFNLDRLCRCPGTYHRNGMEVDFTINRSQNK